MRGEGGCGEKGGRGEERRAEEGPWSGYEARRAQGSWMNLVWNTCSVSCV